MATPAEPYLAPYLRAVARYGDAFPSLLWATPLTQAARFDAIERLGRLDGKSVLDVGCGRADLLDFLLDHGVRPADYVGLEAVEELAAAAERKRLPGCTIVRADFVREPVKMFVGAEVIIFSGSLNTVGDADFYATLRRAFDATADVLIFNFLSSTLLAGQDYLRWRSPTDVLCFAKALSRDVRGLNDYLQGDTTLAVRREKDAAQ